MATNLEFYKKATELRDEFRKSHRNVLYIHFLTTIVNLYFENDDNFPETIFIPDFTYKRIAIAKEILKKLDFPVDDYEFFKSDETFRLWKSEFYNTTILIIRRKQN